MAEPKPFDIDAVLGAPATVRLADLTRIGRVMVEGGGGPANAERQRMLDAMAKLIEEGQGEPRERVALGEVLGLLGDPRLCGPDSDSYWVRIENPQIQAVMQIARFPVTNFEYMKWVDGGGYDDTAAWDEDARAWLDTCEDPWPVRASAASSKQFIVPNQPVVGVTWYEAAAFAKAHGARLPRFDERVWVARGEERRPYPWGSPFGVGNANTQEEVVGRPCAVGLFVRDRTPEGVRDLAGNVAEWNQDGVGEQRWIHPGAWDQPSMAAWAKARFLEARDSRWAGLGFRLARD